LICDDVKVLVLSVASGCTCVTFIFAAQGDPLAACLLVAELGPQRFPFEVTTACAHQVHTVNVTKDRGCDSENTFGIFRFCLIIFFWQTLARQVTQMSLHPPAPINLGNFIMSRSQQRNDRTTSSPHHK